MTESNATHLAGAAVDTSRQEQRRDDSDGDKNHFHGLQSIHALMTDAATCGTMALPKARSAPMRL